MVHEGLAQIVLSKGPSASAGPGQFARQGFSYISYRSDVDVMEWAQLQTTTDSFNTVRKARNHFETEFRGEEKLLAERCFFLKSDQGRYVGSAMAWYGGSPFDASYGRLHWVVIHPDYRGLGLGKALIGFTLYQLSRSYSKAYLTTQTTSLRAIYIYLELGFRPWVNSSRHERAWRLIQDQIRHPSLE